jgi:hypothetical protein
MVVRCFLCIGSFSIKYAEQLFCSDQMQAFPRIDYITVEFRISVNIFVVYYLLGFTGNTAILHQPNQITL